MHTENNYEFATKEDAQEFVSNHKAGNNPSADVYVSGPFLIDESKIFENMSWVIPRKPFWMVTIEIYK